MVEQSPAEPAQQRLVAAHAAGAATGQNNPDQGQARGCHGSAGLCARPGRVFALLFAQRAAFGPGAVAVDIMFLLPDWSLVLDGLNGQPAGAEGLVAVRGGGPRRHGGGAKGPK